MVVYTARNTDGEAGAREFILPVMDGMEAIHFCNTSVQKAARNYARGKPDASIKGVPVANANYVTFQGDVNYLETRTKESSAQTIYCICRPIGDLLSSATQSMAVSTFTRPAAAGGGSTFGAALFFQNPGSGPTVQGIGSRGTSVANHINGTVSLPIPTPSNWRMNALLVKDAVTKNELFDLTNNGHAVSLAANTPRFPSSGFYRIGSSYAAPAFIGQIDIAFVAIASVAHTEAQMQANRAALQAYFDPRGISI
ncbi:hypothetical protein [Pararhizobium sp.]|uniref:hypothetical protein n=1 Tax=Pararhizobium sp. TaxID=1977563 RepID=UPI003D12B55C